MAIFRREERGVSGEWAPASPPWRLGEQDGAARFSDFRPRHSRLLPSHSRLLASPFSAFSPSPFPPSRPSFPPSRPHHSHLLPRHSRESGNPDDCSQARRPKSSTNSSQRIPSPFMGLQGQVSDFGAINDLHALRRRRPRFGRQPRAPPHPRQTTLATMTRSLSESIVESMASGAVAGRPQRQDPSHQRGEAGADVYLIRGWRGAVGAAAEPLAEALPDGGESACEVRAAMTAFRRPLWAVMAPNVHRASLLDCASVSCGMVCRSVR